MSNILVLGVNIDKKRRLIFVRFVFYMKFAVLDKRAILPPHFPILMVPNIRSLGLV